MMRKHVLLIAGPCSLESIDQVQEIVPVMKYFGLTFMRAQLFKPRTRPESFQGLGVEGLPIIRYLLEEQMRLVCEVGSLEQLQVVASFASVIQIGARNMQNFELLKQVGAYYLSSSLPLPFVMLKRGFSHNLEEWLAAARYIEQSGIPPQRIILCERGTRNSAAPYGVTLDFGLALMAKKMSPYTVIMDPSHGSKSRELVLPLANMVLHSPFDGLMLEIHPRPEESWSDAQQAVSLEDFKLFMETHQHQLLDKKNHRSLWFEQGYH
jgi:3-deoxy-7-phosphoheptulonate synthase